MMAKLVHLLDSSNNKIESLPVGLGSCPRLRILDLSLNKIKEVQGNYYLLNTLKILHLSDNELVTLPEEIGKLVNLETVGGVICSLQLISLTYSTNLP